MNFDEILSSVGEFGRYQKWLLFIVCVPACLPAAITMYTHVFISAVPKHHCKSLITAERTARLKNCLSPSEDHLLALKTLFLPRGPEGSFETCRQYDVNINSVIDRVLNQTEFTNSTILEEFVARNPWPSLQCRHGWEFDTEEYTETVATKFEVVCEQEWLLSTAQTMFFIGGMIGAVIFGWISDRWGRKPALVLSTALMVIGNLAMIGTPNYLWYIILRFIVGISYPSVYNLGFVLAAEAIGVTQRTTASAVCDMAYSVGLMLLPLMAHFSGHWQILQALISIPMLIFTGFFWILPESPRWLISQGRMDEAETIVRKMADVNGKPLAPDFFSNYKAKNPEPAKTGGEDHVKVGISQLLNYPKVALKVIVICVVWSISSMVVHGMSFATPILPTATYLAFFMGAVCAVPGVLLAGVTMPCCRRRASMFASLFASGVFATATAFVPEDIPWLAVLFPSLAKLSSTFTYTVIYIFAGELLPTVIRGFGIGLAATGQQIGMIVTPYIIFMGNVHGRLIPFMIYGIFAFLAAFLVLILPETLNAPLPTTMDESEYFEDFVRERTKHRQPDSRK